MDDKYIEQVRQDSERCMGIFLKTLPESECSKCTYRHLGVNCIPALAAAQAIVIKELERRNKNEQT